MEKLQLKVIGLKAKKGCNDFNVCCDLNINRDYWNVYLLRGNKLSSFS